MGAIVIKNLKKKYGQVAALQGISFRIASGEFFALLGQNGAGKTTTINILTGLSTKTSGTVTLFGKDVVADYKEARQLIGLVPQEFNFDKFETVWNILKFNAGFFGMSNERTVARITTLLKDLKLWEKRHMKAITLSGGMKRKLMIARGLLHEPKILILDEPTAGVDVETRQTIWDFMQKLNAQGTTILLTTHYLEEAERLCDRIAIIHKGEIIALEHKKALLEQMGAETVVLTLTKKTKLPAALQVYSPVVEGNKVTFALPRDVSWATVLKAVSVLPIEDIQIHKNTLEDVFLRITQ